MYTVLPILNSCYKLIISKYLSVISTISDNTKQPDEYVENIVCQVSDLVENEPKVFSLDEGKVLVIKQKGKIHALGNKCTHYGAPLISSAVGDGRLRCQWHGACFSLETGDIEDFPGKLAFCNFMFFL